MLNLAKWTGFCFRNQFPNTENLVAMDDQAIVLKTEVTAHKTKIVPVVPVAEIMTVLAVPAAETMTVLAVPAAETVTVLAAPAAETVTVLAVPAEDVHIVKEGCTQKMYLIHPAKQDTGMMVICIYCIKKNKKNKKKCSILSDAALLSIWV